MFVPEEISMTDRLLVNILDRRSWRAGLVNPTQLDLCGNRIVLKDFDEDPNWYEVFREPTGKWGCI
jgi:hypothetical protein